MYSVVMMMALGTAGESPEFLFKRRDRGCNGCYASCHGCYGSGYGYRAASCYGSCYGSYSASCYGSSYASCYGSCYGSYYAPYYNSCHGYHSGCYAAPVNVSCYGGYSAYYPSTAGSCYGYGMPMTVPQHPPIVVPHDPVVPSGNPGTGGDDATDDNIGSNPGVSFRGDQAINTARPTDDSVDPQRAQVTVTLPADAKLYVDGHLTQLTSAVRQFHTPILQPATDYVYTFRIEYDRNGPQSEEKRVIVRAGKITQIEFVEKPNLVVAEEHVSVHD